MKRHDSPATECLGAVEVAQLAAIALVCFLMLGVIPARLRAQEKQNVIEMEDGGVKARLELGKFSMDSNGDVVAEARGSMLIGDPIAYLLIQAKQAKANAASKCVSDSVVWLEPAERREVMKAFLTREEIPGEALTALGFSRDQAPQLKLFVRVRTANQAIEPIICDGMVIYGATRGPVTIDGEPHSRLRAAKIVGGHLVSSGLPKRKHQRSSKRP